MLASLRKASRRDAQRPAIITTLIGRLSSEEADLDFARALFDETMLRRFEVANRADRRNFIRASASACEYMSKLEGIRRGSKTQKRSFVRKLNELETQVVYAQRQGDERAAPRLTNDLFTIIRRHAPDDARRPQVDRCERPRGRHVRRVRTRATSSRGDPERPEPPRPTDLQRLLGRFGELLRDARVEGGDVYDVFLDIVVEAVAKEAARRPVRRVAP
jgi:hypothetical protein